MRSSRTSSPCLWSQTLLVGTKGYHQGAGCCSSLCLLSPGCCGKAKQIPVLGSTHHREQGLLQGVEGRLSGASTQGTCQNKAYGHEPEKNEL